MALQFSDNFNRSNSADLGSNWTTNGGNALSIANSVAQSGVGAGLYYGGYWNADSLGASTIQYVQASVTPPSEGHGGLVLWGNASFSSGSTGSGYYLRVTLDQLAICEITNGVIGTPLAVTSGSGSATYRLTWDPFGAVSAYVDGFKVMEVSDATVTPTRAGLLAYSDSSSSAGTFDLFEGGTDSYSYTVDEPSSGWGDRSAQWLAVHPITGALWRAKYVSSNDTIVFGYSTNGGQSWTSAPSLTFPSRTSGITADYDAFAFEIDYQGVGYLSVHASGIHKVYATGEPAPNLAASMSSASTWSTVLNGATAISSSFELTRLSIKVSASAGNRKVFVGYAVQINNGSSTYIRALVGHWQNSGALQALSWTNDQRYGLTSLSAGSGVHSHDILPPLTSSTSDYADLVHVRLTNTRTVVASRQDGQSSANPFSTWTDYTLATGSGGVPLSTDGVACSFLGYHVLFAWVMNDPTAVEIGISPFNTNLLTQMVTVTVPALNDGNITSLRATSYGDEWRVYVTTANGNLHVLRVDRFSKAATPSGWEPLHVGGGISGVRDSMVIAHQPTVDGTTYIGYVEDQSGTDYYVVNSDSRKYLPDPYVSVYALSDYGGYDSYSVWATRNVTVDATGRTWAIFYDPYRDNGPYDVLMWSDDGVQWNEHLIASIGAYTSYGGELFSDYAGRIWWTRSTSSATTTWVLESGASAKTNVTGLTNYLFTEGAQIAFEDPEGTGYILARFAQQATTAYLTTARFDNSHALISGSLQTISFTGLSGGQLVLDFEHTGDGRTATSSPDIYIAYQQDGVGLKWGRLQYDGNLSARYASTVTYLFTMDDTDMATGDRLAGYFDGTNSVIAYTETGSENIKIYDGHNLSGSTWSWNVRTPPAFTDGTVKGNTGGGYNVSYDAAKNIIVTASGSTSKDVLVALYDRAANSWSSWNQIAATVNPTPSINGRAVNAARRVHPDRNAVPILWAEGANPPLVATYYEYSIDSAPDTPTLLSPSSGNQDINNTLGFQWTFDDINANDYQSGYAIKRVVSGVTHYWRASTQSWLTTEYKNPSVVSESFLPAYWATASATVQQFSVKVWDSTNLASAYSTAVSVTPSVRHDPTMVEPTFGYSYPADSTEILVDWTVTSQSQYRVIFRDSETNVDLHDTDWVTSTNTSYVIPVSLVPEHRYAVLLQTIGATGSPSYSFESLVVQAEIYSRRDSTSVAVVLTDNDYLTAPSTRVVRYVDIYEADGVTEWRSRVPVISGSVSIEASPTSKRTLSLSIASRSPDYPEPYEIDSETGIWYDKVVRPYRGVVLDDGTEKIWPLGVFHIDTLADADFPNSIEIQGRDKFKVLENSKFAVPTQFSANLDLFSVVRAIATNAGITSISLPAEVISLGYDWLFEQNSSRGEAIEKLVESFGYTVVFDGSGTLMAEKIPDPYAGALEYSFTTGESGNMVTWKRSASDAEIFNRVIVVGESSSKLAVYGDAQNNVPNSPTRIARIGERVKSLNLSSITTTQQAQDLADRLLAVHSLEQFEINVTSIVVPWLKAGDIIEVLTESDSLNQGAPSRFLLSSLSIPLGLEPMSLTGRRLAIVG
jgi:hypothetical protein